MTDALETTLCKNIKVNLGDTTNYTTVAGNIKNILITDEFRILNKQSVYTQIVLDEPEEEQTGISSIIWWQPVGIHIAYRRGMTPNGEQRAIGKSGVAGLATRAKDVRQALNRESPYNDMIPTGGPTYTTQTGVLRAVYAGTEYRTEEEPGHTPVDVAKVTMRYLCVDTRSA